jgi:hypothetical protein
LCMCICECRDSEDPWDGVGHVLRGLTF